MGSSIHPVPFAPTLLDWTTIFLTVWVFVLQTSFYFIMHIAYSSSPLIPAPILPFLLPSINTALWSCLPVSTNRSTSILLARPGEELADEHVLHGGMSCELSAFWLVSLVRVFSNMWPHRFVCALFGIRLMVKEYEIKCPSCFKSYQIVYRKVESGYLIQNI